MGIKVGIDLGTTFSAVAVMDEKKGQPVIIPNTNGENITPSVIQFTEDGDMIVGSDAKDAYESGEYGCASAFKRGMGKPGEYCNFYGKSYTAEDLSAILLHHLVEEAEAVTHQKVEEAVITVPAYFGAPERLATLHAAEKAGLSVRQLISEPTAAAMNYGANHWRENAKILVYDLGGGTFDVTLVRLEKDGQMKAIATKGDRKLGGKDWDERISQMIANKIAEDTGVQAKEDRETWLRIKQGAETLKKQLTQKENASIKIWLENQGWYTVEMTLAEFERETRDLIERTGALCENLLQSAKLTWSDITDVLLVGGSTRMRQVSTYLKEISRHEPIRQVNPDEAVALGAAIQVHLPHAEYVVIPIGEADDGKKSEQAKSGLFGRKKEQPARSSYTNNSVGREYVLADATTIRQSDVIAHAMGVIAVNKEGTHYINKTIVPANQRIPVKGAESFHFHTTSGDNELEIFMLQGTGAPLECDILGKYVVTGIRHDRNDNPTTIRIQYSYDVNGIVHVQARQGNDQKDLPIRMEPVDEDMSRFGRPIDPAEQRVTAQPLSLAMALDVSGSMSGTPMTDAQAAMCHFVDEFSDYPGDVQIGVIAVSDHSLIVQHLTRNGEMCKKAIRSMTCGMTGYCNAAHPFADILSMLKNETGRRIAIVLADGVWEAQSIAIAKAKLCHKENIEVIGIGFGYADEQFLKAISNGDVSSMKVSQSELTQSFGKIAQEIGSNRTDGRKGRRSEDSAQAETWLAIGEYHV